MQNKHTEDMFQEFRMYRPWMAEKTTDYYLISPWRLMVIMENGYRVVYNSINNATRLIPPGEPSEDEWRKRFGACLDDILMEENIRQDELAEQSGISQASISRYIRGFTATPSAYVLDRIARALNRSPQDLLAYI